MYMLGVIIHMHSMKFVLIIQVRGGQPPVQWVPGISQS